MQIIEDKVYAFSKDNPPCYTAQPGEVLQFNTLDCFSGRLTDETVTMKDMDFSYNITNPAAGPVYVEGAEVGRRSCRGHLRHSGGRRGHHRH